MATTFIATRAINTQTVSYGPGAVVDLTRFSTSERDDLVRTGGIVSSAFVRALATQPEFTDGFDAAGTAAAAVAAQAVVDSGTYVPQPGDGVTGKNAQYPTALTKTVTGVSAHVLQNNDANAPDNGTRFYIVPRATVTTGVGSVIKLFGDDYTADQTNYRDLGLYFSADQNSDTGTRGHGVFWVNGKVNGTYVGQSPDIGFSMQDGQYVAGRVALAAVGGVTPNIQWVFGPSAPRIGAKIAVAAEVQGDLGFGTNADSAIRWQRSDAGATTDNAISLQRTAAGGNVKFTLGSSQRLLLNNAGSLVLGNGSTALATNSTDGFLYLSSMAGVPSGTPTAQGAAVPVVIDSTDSRLYAYIGGAWKSVTLS